MTKDTSPKLQRSSFVCPSCGVLAQQLWSPLHVYFPERDDYEEVENHHVSECHGCEGIAVWKGDQLVFRPYLAGPNPNPDLSDEVRADYEEARYIAQASPRGAAALLRLAIQKLCRDLGESGDNINADIASLMKKGLDPRVQQMLDFVRVTGNNAVHPGEMNIHDNPELVTSLFGLINRIADQLITQPREMDELYAQLPQSARDAITKRDRNQQGKEAAS